MVAKAPADASSALRWIQGAVAAGRYIPDAHLWKRIRERGSSLAEVLAIVRTESACEAYQPERGPLCGGTSRRLWGRDLDGERAGIGAEAFHDTGKERAVLITILGGDGR